VVVSAVVVVVVSPADVVVVSGVEVVVDVVVEVGDVVVDDVLVVDAVVVEVEVVLVELVVVVELPMSNGAENACGPLTKALLKSTPTHRTHMSVASHVMLELPALRRMS
jgi:hypothetical protein